MLLLAWPRPHPHPGGSVGRFPLPGVAPQRLRELGADLARGRAEETPPPSRRRPRGYRGKIACSPRLYSLPKIRAAGYQAPSAGDSGWIHAAPAIYASSQVSGTLLQQLKHNVTSAFRGG